MKKTVLLMGIIALLISGCAMSMNGGIYTDTVEPINAASNERGAKTGEASCTNILGLIATGDCSIDTAAKNANIRAIKSVDRKRYGILGLYLKETTIVTGD